MNEVKPLCDAFAEVYFLDRYPGFELDDPDWNDLRSRVAEVAELLDRVKARITVN